MATSGKTSKTTRAKTTGTGRNGTKKAAQSPVIDSAPVAAGGPVVSRIPPSIPIESGLVGKAETPLPAASRKDARDGATPTPIPAVAREPDPEAPPATPEPRAETVRTEPSRSDAAQAETVRRGGFWPMLLGGVVAAGLGAGAAIWALPQLAPPADAPEIDIEALRAQASEAGASAGAEAAGQAIAALPPAGADDEIQAQLQAQAERIAALEAALADRPEPSRTAGQAASTMPRESGNDAGGDPMAELAALRADLSAQARQIAELSARPQLDAQELERMQALAQDAEGMKAEIEAAAAQARDSLSAVQTEADAATRRAQTIASVAALGAALEHGDAPGEAVRHLQDAGVEVPEALAQEDLPTLVQIQMGFDAVARAALRESLKAESQTGGAMTAVGNFLRVQTGARSVEPREGDDPDAVLSRAGALVDQGEIAAALDEIAALPPEGQQAMAEWAAQARGWLEAEAALNDVATTLN